MIVVKAGEIYVLPDVFVDSPITYDIQIVGLPVPIGSVDPVKRTIRSGSAILTATASVVSADTVSLTVSAGDPGGHYEVELQLTDTQGNPMNRSLSAYIGVCVETV